MKKIVATNLIIILIISMFAGCGTKAKSTEEHISEIDETVSELISSDASTNDRTIVDKWKNENGQAVLNKVYETMPLNVDFINANIALYYGEKDKAISILERCIEYKVTEDNVDIIAKSKYEYAKLLLYKQKYDAALKQIDEIDALYKRSSDRDAQIYIYTLWSYDVLEIPDGSNKAEDIMEYAVELAEKYGFKNMAYIYYQMAFVYSYSGRYESISEYNLKALRAARENKDTYWIASISSDIGVNYYCERNYSKAEDYLINAFSQIHEKNEKEHYKNVALEIYITDMLSCLYIEMDDLDNAAKYMEISSNLLNMMEDGKEKTDNITKTYATKAAYYIKKGYYTDALDNINIAAKRYEAEDFFLYTNFDTLLGQLYGAAYLGMGNKNKAQAYYEKAIEDFEKGGVQFTDPDTIVDLYRIYVEKEDVEKERAFTDRIIEMLSYYVDGNTRNTSMLLEEFEATERENEIEMLKFKNNSLSHVIGSTVLLIGIALYFGLMLIRRNKQIKNLNEKLVEASMKDELTKLNNRRALNVYLENEWANICNGKQSISVAMLDVDFFKKYNDYYGHIAGDEVLADIAYAISQKFGDGFFTSRYGGEEFLIIMPGVSKESAEEKLNDLRMTIGTMAIPHEKSSVSQCVTVSIGVASTQEAIGYIEMIHYADNALYVAKRERNTIVLSDCTEGM